jgi:hypothetical protein
MMPVIGGPSGNAQSALNDGRYFNLQRITPMGSG